MQHLSCFYRPGENQVFIDNERYNGTCLIFTEYHRYSVKSIKSNSKKKATYCMWFLQVTIQLHYISELNFLRTNFLKWIITKDFFGRS